MRVVHVATAFPRYDGDIITPWLGTLLLGLRERGLEVSVLAPSYRGGGATEWRGIPVRRFRYAPAWLETLTHDEATPDRLHAQPAYAALLPGYMLGGSLASQALGADNPPDIVHVHWPLPHAWFGALVQAASDGHTAVVSTFHSVEVRWVERRLRWARPLLSWSVELSDAVTVNSTATAAAVGRYADSDVPVIPFSAAVSDERTPTSPINGPPPPTRRQGTVRLLFVGRLVDRKGVHVLIRALAQVREHLDATLTVIGHGPKAAELRAEAIRAGVESSVRFAGFVDEEELASAYRTSDIFVLPAVVDAKGDTEGLGVVLLEAMEFGLPVIASDTGGIPDIVRHEETGLLVPPGDAAALARAVIQVVRHPEATMERVEQGRTHIRDHFGLQGVVDRLLCVYEGAIASRRGSASTTTTP